MPKYPSPSEEPRVRMVELRLVAEAKAHYRVIGPADVARLVQEMVGDADREHFVAIYLDARHRATHVQTVAIGHLTGALVHPREVFKGALLANASALVVGHNHPSGDPSPSPEDRAVHDRLRNAGQLIGVELLDAVIVGSGRSFYSLADERVREF